MGYSTVFTGCLFFTQELDQDQKDELMKYFGEDCRDHPEWDRMDLTWIDLHFNDDESGIEWNGSEKAYDMVDKVNLIILRMQHIWPEFGLRGLMTAAGDDGDDRWVLTIGGDGYAKYIDYDTYLTSNYLPDKPTEAQVLEASEEYTTSFAEAMKSKKPNKAIIYYQAEEWLKAWKKVLRKEA